MAGAMMLGLLLALAGALLDLLAPQPAGWAVYWALIAAQLAWAARTCWRRTGLPYATAAMVVAGAMSAVLAGMATAGHLFPELARAWWWPLVLAGIAGPVLLQVESRAHPAEWRQWGAFMAESTLWDILTMRHIPDLRSGARPSPGERGSRG